MCQYCREKEETIKKLKAELIALYKAIKYIANPYIN